MSEQSDLHSVCQDSSTWHSLSPAQEHLLPTLLYHPHIAVGHDSFGTSTMSLAEYTAREALLNQRYIERFAEPLKRDHAKFATTSIFGLLEACIARCTQARSVTASASPVEESIHQLLTILGT